MRLIYIPFFISLLTGLFLLNWALYFPICKGYRLRKEQCRKVFLTLLFLSLVMVWGETIRRIWGISLFSFVGNIWLGTLAISFTVMVFNILYHFISSIVFRYLKSDSKEQVRALINKWITSFSLLLIISLSVIAYINNNRPPRVRSINLYSDKINKETEGLKVALVSEFHIISSTSSSRVNRIIDRINNLRPDIVIIAGDLIDDNISRIWHIAPLLRYLEAVYGVYVVAGNHDYYHNFTSFSDFSDLAKLEMLLNESRQIVTGLSLVGITDPTAKSFDLEEPDIEKAFKGVNYDDFIIFVAHQPIFTEEALDAGSDLILAGHSHKGQIPPMTALVTLRYKYHYGLFSKPGQRYVYTTSGVDIWGPPMRLGSNNEIVLFTLNRTISDYSKYELTTDQVSDLSSLTENSSNE